MALQLWDDLKDSITAYTGLSPATFFTVVALALAFYYVVSGLFGSSDHGHHQRSRDFEEQTQALPPPVQLGEITEEELKKYDGSDPDKPLLMAIKGQIYDVSQSRYSSLSASILSYFAFWMCGNLALASVSVSFWCDAFGFLFRFLVPFLIVNLGVFS